MTRRIRRWSGDSQVFSGALEVRQVLLGDLDGLGLVRDSDVDHAVGHLDLHRSNLFRSEDAEAAALDHGRAAHANVRVRGSDDDIADAEHGGVAGEAAARCDPDHRHQAAELGEARESAAAAAATTGVIAGPAAPALGEQDDGHTGGLGHVDHAVGLAVVAATLGAGEHRVVVTDHGAARGRLAEQVAVDVADADDHAVSRSLFDQVLERAPAGLVGEDKGAVLDPRARVDQVHDVGAGGALALRGATGDGVRAVLIVDVGAAVEDLLEVGADVVQVGGLFVFGPGRANVRFFDKQQRVALVQRIADRDADAADNAAGRGPDLVLHLHRFHDHDGLAGAHGVAGLDLDRDDGALERRLDGDCAVGRRTGCRGRRCGLGRARGWRGGLAVGEHREGVVGVDPGAGAARRAGGRFGYGRGSGLRWGRRRHRHEARWVRRRAFADERRQVVFDEARAVAAGAEVGVQEDALQEPDVGLDAFDAELGKRPVGPVHGLGEDVAAAMSDNLREQRIVSRAGLVAGVAKGVDAHTGAGGRVEGGKQAAGRHGVAVRPHGLHVHAHLDGVAARRGHLVLPQTKARERRSAGQLELDAHQVEARDLFRDRVLHL